MADDVELIEMDAGKCRAIVASLRMYIHFCEEARNALDDTHIRDIAHMRDNATKALYAASKIGA